MYKTIHSIHRQIHLNCAKICGIEGNDCNENLIKSKNLFDVKSISNSVQRLARYRIVALISIGRLCSHFVCEIPLLLNRFKKHPVISCYTPHTQFTAAFWSIIARDITINEQLLSNRLDSTACNFNATAQRSSRPNKKSLLISYTWGKIWWSRSSNHHLKDLTFLSAGWRWADL